MLELIISNATVVGVIRFLYPQSKEIVTKFCFHAINILS